jgi:hypothetical protein
MRPVPDHGTKPLQRVFLAYADQEAKPNGAAFMRAQTTPSCS